MVLKTVGNVRVAIRRMEKAAVVMFNIDTSLFSYDT